MCVPLSYDHTSKSHAFARTCCCILNELNAMANSGGVKGDGGGDDDDDDDRPKEESAALFNETFATDTKGETT